MDTLESHRQQIRTRVATARAALQSHALDALLVPSSDPHLSEYLPERWQGRQWLSGFTGSMGTLIVTPEFAGVWADSRYWVQADAQLAGTGITLMKIGGAASAAHIDWLAQSVRTGGTVSVDGAVLSLASARALQTAFVAKAIALRTEPDLLDAIWPDRPGLPTRPVYEHTHAPVARPAKLALVREAMHACGAQWHFIATLDDICWLTNLRGDDVPYNPVFLAHLVVGLDDAVLFVGAGKVPPPIAARLAADGIRIADYRAAATRLAQFADTTLLIDPKRITFGLRQAVATNVTVIEQINPSTLAKSRKTAEEIEQIRRTMEHDGVALAEFLSWLETELDRPDHGRLTEISIDERLGAARAGRPGFVSPSFATIAGYNANGAMPHYRATPESHAVIDGDGLLLIDSGGQYETGTTDITRVIPVGTPSAEQKRDFTLVLKGMIQLSLARFPRGTRSPLLDTLARAPIWAAGVDYGHGTGHGVGYFLNVHEGPHGITPHLPPEPQTAMEPGMITSNEPGIYRPGRWGVRIENLVLNVPASAPGMSEEFGEFLQFETLTLCPIDARCIDMGLLRADEIAWLNRYHDEVRRRLAPLVKGPALAWLQRRTEAI